MAKKFSSLLLVLVIVLTVSLLYAAESSWTGVVSDSHCGAKHNKASKAAENCVENMCVKGGSEYVFVNGADNKVYKLSPQDKLKGHGGHEVKVTGTVEGDTINVKSVEMVAESK